jgi:hypothetical protein
VIGTIAKKSALDRSILQLVIVVRTDEWITQTAKDSKKYVVRFSVKKSEIW